MNTSGWCDNHRSWRKKTRDHNLYPARFQAIARGKSPACREPVGTVPHEGSRSRGTLSTREEHTQRPGSMFPSDPGGDASMLPHPAPLFYQQENRDLERKGNFLDRPPRLWQSQGLVTLPPRTPAAICLQLSYSRHRAAQEGLVSPPQCQVLEQMGFSPCTRRAVQRTGQAEQLCACAQTPPPPPRPGPDAHLHIADSQAPGGPRPSPGAGLQDPKGPPSPESRTPGEGLLPGLPSPGNEAPGCQSITEMRREGVGWLAGAGTLQASGLEVLT